MTSAPLSLWEALDRLVRDTQGMWLSGPKSPITPNLLGVRGAYPVSPDFPYLEAARLHLPFSSQRPRPATPAGWNRNSCCCFEP